LPQIIKTTNTAAYQNHETKISDHSKLELVSFLLKNRLTNFFEECGLKFFEFRDNVRQKALHKSKATSKKSKPAEGPVLLVDSR
jgi:hypothetical protein